jgi:hypothetical protein
MPRERIHHGALILVDNMNQVPERIYRPDEPQPVNTTIRQQPSLDVTWNREGSYVQVSIDVPSNIWLSQAEEIKEMGMVSMGIFTDVMDRREINHMIRTLRRARDAAYGADE